MIGSVVVLKKFISNYIALQHMEKVLLCSGILQTQDICEVSIWKTGFVKVKGLLYQTVFSSLVDNEDHVHSEICSIPVRSLCSLHACTLGMSTELKQHLIR